MYLSRREFLRVLAIAAASGMNLSGCSKKSKLEQYSSKNKFGNAPTDMYELPSFGNVSIMHITDTHAQLLPVYFREPSMNLGFGRSHGRPPHLVGEYFLKQYNIPRGTLEAHAFTFLDFAEAATKYGKLGGYAHLATLINHIRSQRKGAILLDGGDTWQGSATSLWTKGQDMIDASIILGVDVMTGHWEFTYGADRVKEVVENDLDGTIDFVAQNILDNEFEDEIFKPYVMKEINGIPVAIIGQAFPYTPIANPRYMMPKWSFGVREERMQEMVDRSREEGAQVVVLLSHNGMDVDLKMAGAVTGIDAIMGGHTHDAIPIPVPIKNAKGTTLVINSGSAGKFLSVLDFDVKNGHIRDYRFKILPVFSNFIEPEPIMAKHIADVRKPFKEKLERKLAVTNDLLYRRGTFNGSFDQLILNALLETQDAEIAFSPGFRWGMNVLAGEWITFEDLMTHTAITYPQVTINKISGEQIKFILESVADNIFNDDPYYQQGGDMVRVGGLTYSIDPTKKMEHRISNMMLHGNSIDASKKYNVAGWASVRQDVEGPAIWDVVADYLVSKKTVSIKNVNVPSINKISDNPGFALT